MTTAAWRRPPLTFSDDEIRRFGEARAIVRDQVLGGHTAAAIAADLPIYESELLPAHMGRGAARWLDQTERGDEITWIEPSAAPTSFAALFGAFDQVMAGLNRGAYLGLRRYDVQLARYSIAGARYARHADAFRARYQVNRLATAIYYVNPGWRPDHGGILRVFGESTEIDIEPLLDRLVVFASERVEHEVLPCFAPRTAITAWFYSDPT